MNERIGNNRIYVLAKEAGLIEFEQFPWNPALGSPTYESVEKARKFAELIVQECMGIISDESEKVSDEWRCKDGKHIWWKIKEHFGVE